MAEGSSLPYTYPATMGTPCRALLSMAKTELT